jgi:predicted Zn-dependent peptidase
MDIAASFDAVGGEANAVTGKEHTCYYARVLDEDLPLAIDLIADMVTSATLTPADVESERGVILEELAMNDDDPSDVVHERFCELVLGDLPLGRPIGGTADTIGAVGREDIAAHYHQHYVPEGLVVTVAGGIDHDQVCERVGSELAGAGWQLPAERLPLSRRPITTEVSVPTKGGQLVISRQTEQAHVVLGCPGLTATDPQRYVMTVLNGVLGGGMSSRLFQEVRERRGLAYSVYSFSSAYADSGYFGLYAGCAPGKIDEVISVLRSELERMAADGITAEELARAHGQLSGGLVLGLEDSGSRMSRLGKAELVHGEYLSLDDSLASVRAVTAEQVRVLAAELASRPRSVAVVGPFDQGREFSATGA